MQTGIRGAERVVLLQPQRQEVSDRDPDKPGDGGRILEGHRERQGGGVEGEDHRNEENTCVLPR